jgi:fused signal recognition particle receptor
MSLFNPFKRKSKTEDIAPVTAEKSEDTASPIKSEDTVVPPADDRTIADSAAAEQPEAKPKGLFARFRAGLKRTAQILNTDIRDLFKQEGRLVDDEFLDQVFAMMVRTDMGVNPARTIREDIQKEFRGRVVTLNDLLTRVKQTLRTLMAQDEKPIEVKSKPTVIMVVGVNGSGKTTSIAKLTRLLIDQGHRVVLGAGDTFRAAAVEQLTIWAQRLNTEIITGKPASDPASVAHRAVTTALESSADVCIIDTAGRLQTQTNLMEQLSKIRRVIQKQIPEAPHEVLLVLDATAGQNGLSQAKGFADAVSCTGIILAKLDGTAKGGVVIPIRQQFAIPVRYVGVGEKPEDLALFDPDQFVEALFAEVPAN